MSEQVEKKRYRWHRGRAGKNRLDPERSPRTWQSPPSVRPQDRISPRLAANILIIVSCRKHIRFPLHPVTSSPEREGRNKNAVWVASLTATSTHTQQQPYTPVRTGGLINHSLYFREYILHSASVTVSYQGMIHGCGGSLALHSLKLQLICLWQTFDGAAGKQVHNCSRLSLR